MDTHTGKPMNFDPMTLFQLFITALASIGGGFMVLRRINSRDRVGRASDQAQIDMIKSLNDLLADERKARKEAEIRADGFAKERNDAIQLIGEMKGQIKALSEKVDDMRKQLDVYAQR